MSATDPAVAVGLRATRCAICGTDGNAEELYPANFSPDALNPRVFSARRLPDEIRYRMVRCRRCGLVRSDPIADPELLDQLYRRSTFDYGPEIDGLRQTYGRCLADLRRCGGRREALLEIGCGTGFMLEEALDQGYATVRGVEPSVAAVAQASPRVRDGIVCDVMRPGLFAPDAFDVVCMFQVFDHLPEPGTVLDECRRVLKPGGLLLCVNHNVRAVSARLLGKRSPIIDIEHTFLYSPRTMARLVGEHGFAVRHVGPIRNSYALRYLAQLIPFPAAPKRALLGRLRHWTVGGIRLSVPLGNLQLVAQKPEAAEESRP